MIALCTPTRSSMLAGYVADLAAMLRVDTNVEFIPAIGTLLSNLRSGLVKGALCIEASHVLFVDSDMRFPADAARRLLARGKDIIGANCKMRTGNGWTARDERGGQVSSDKQTGVKQVSALGFGVTLIAREVFESITEPWFDMPWDGKKHVGEDVSFCAKARAAGFGIWIDHDLSQVVKHSGMVELGA